MTIQETERKGEIKSKRVHKVKSWLKFGIRMEENASGNAKMLHHFLRRLRERNKRKKKLILVCLLKI